MKAIDMMNKISKTLNDGEAVEVRVAHRGAWSGAHHYTITAGGVEYLGHFWMSYGTLRDIYARRVLGR